MTDKMGEVVDAAAAIKLGTYPEMAQLAVSLYERLRYEQAHVGEPVEFAGDVGLDVGGYDGPYRSVIGALGLKRVVTVEPLVEAGQAGVAEGIIPPDDLFVGTLQGWLKAGNHPADSAFAFNVMPSLPNDASFVRAMAAAVKVGGIVVTTFREPATSHQFAEAFRRSPALGIRMLYDPSVPRLDLPQFAGVRNKFLYLWRREQ
jgi:hypothetical protein